MKIYLSGPMTGHPAFNFPAFHERATSLRALGYEVVNPAELNLDVDRSLPPEVLWQTCLRRDIRELSHCDAIAMMPGWQESRGANLERDIALQLGLPVLDSETIRAGLVL